MTGSTPVDRSSRLDEELAIKSEWLARFYPKDWWHCGFAACRPIMKIFPVSLYDKTLEIREVEECVETEATLPLFYKKLHITK